jgi:exodeoxyribonuclease VII small subunit
MKKKTFEAALARLEQIVADLEQGEPELDTGLKKFNEGLQLVRFCNQKLDEAGSRVELRLNKDKDNLITAADHRRQVKMLLHDSI